MTAPENRNGLFDAAGRILEQILATPRIRQSIRLLLNHLDPENATRIVRAITRTDPELFLSLVTSLPTIANACTHATTELVETSRNYSTPLLSAQVTGMVEQLDAHRLGQNTAALIAMATRVLDEDSPALNDAGKQCGMQFAAGFAEGMSRENMTSDQLIERLGQAADGVAAWIDNHPAPMSRIITPIVEAGKRAMNQTKVGENND